jgi:hypothetical protein
MTDWSVLQVGARQVPKNDGKPYEGGTDKNTSALVMAGTSPAIHEDVMPAKAGIQ